METDVKKIPHVEFWKKNKGWLLYIDLRPGRAVKIGNAPV